MSTKVLLVVDTKNSAMGISASRFAKLSGCEIVSALEFSNPKSFLEYVGRQRPEKIIFVRRRILLEILEMKKTHENLMSLKKNIGFYFVIADHLGLEQKYLSQEKVLFDFSNGYFTTSKILFNKYNDIYPNFPPVDLYRDLPNLDNIKKVQSESIEKNPYQVVWVGNSAWGRNYGFNDHKGLKSLVEPLMKKMKISKSEFSFVIIDSNSRPISNIEVLREIARSSFLIQTSQSEGTGLPVLEALSMGTIPITTDVGVAGEVLKGSFAANIVDGNVNAFETRLVAVTHMPNVKDDLVSIFEDYSTKCAFPQFSNRDAFRLFEPKPYMKGHFRTNLIWRIRYIKNLFRNLKYSD